MSVDTSVIGIKAPDKKWQKMKAVYDVCMAAKVQLPSEVTDFFDGCEPDPMGVEVDLVKQGAMAEWRNDWARGFLIDVKKLPDDVTHIRISRG